MNAQVIPLFSGFPQGDVAEVIAEGIEAGERVVAGDPNGDVVTKDLYALGLRAATREREHPVRVLTAAIDYLWGWRDFLRGPKPAPYGYFGPNCRLTEYDCLEHFGVTK